MFGAGASITVGVGMLLAHAVIILDSNIMHTTVATRITNNLLLLYVSTSVCILPIRSYIHEKHKNDTLVKSVDERFPLARFFQGQRYDISSSIKSKSCYEPYYGA